MIINFGNVHCRKDLLKQCFRNIRKLPVDTLFLRSLKAEGEVSEWLKEHAWKVCIVETLSRVRIPPSPLVKT